MVKRKRLPALPLLSLAAGISSAIGLLVPTVFEWGQKPAAQSHYPGMEQMAFAVFVVTSVSCFVESWLYGRRTGASAKDQSRLQFGLRHLFVAMTAVAVLIVVMQWLDIGWAAGAVTLCALSLAAWSCRYDVEVRIRIAALLAVHFLPFVWLIAFNVPFGRTSGLAVMLPVGPAMLPGALIRSLIDSASVDHIPLISAVIVIGQLLFGAWLAMRYPRSAVVYIVFVLVLSTLSSLLLHAMYRA